ncbi:putative origin recognition complex protein 1 [Gregarina niphandrodes]|uniref:Origin recognition complex subunit 1 n=1 Tax=Gregarina niphandrodes TaxID=110365 RepID=A0A023B624_GRENI|nr:putative origin recognition complex protein 1 [Gregarina niphandrodes]EZG65160.1 putative origin recognition complex protein 1 [Gregarina niphandrodes]|eukprot:XP_011134094.1 putative origin recognition complex protein 1 [Gregarina niphandrodes]
MNEVLQSLQIRECDLACELKGREKEVRLLTVAFKKSITTPGGPGHLHYVAGQPGTGKTLTVKYVLKRLTRDGLKFRMGEVNILRMASSTMIFRELYKLALPKKSLAGDYYTELGKYMKKKRMSLKIRLVGMSLKIVLVIDEFDNLNFRNRAFNEKLYEVFDWTHLPNAALTVICIANTIALPDTIVPRCSSRLGNGSIIFPAYTWQQLYDVVMERSGGKILSLFDETALQLRNWERRAGANENTQGHIT